MKIGALICGYDDTLDMLGDLSASLSSAGLYTVIGYDAHDRMPDTQTVNACDFFFSGGGAKGKQDGELRSIRIGSRVLLENGCDYMIKLCGDSIIRRPEAIIELVSYLDDKDIMASQWWDQCGTMVFFGKCSMIARVFSALRSAPPQIEKRFTAALKNQKESYIIHYCVEGDMGVWETIGFSRHSENYPPRGDPRG